MNHHQNNRKRSWLYRNGLSVFFLTMFTITLVAQALTGWRTHNGELHELGAASLSFGQYLSSGHFVSATFENFESEFLQMALYVMLTISLRQIGSAESKKIDQPEKVDREPLASKAAPWPVKKGGNYTEALLTFAKYRFRDILFHKLGLTPLRQLGRS